jgi:hypothetical protein
VFVCSRNIATGTYRTKKNRRSRMGSLYYNSITTLATLPRRSRQDQPEDPPPAHFTRHLPCEGQEHGDARWLRHHGATQPERMASQWCTSCSERRCTGGDKTPPGVPRNQELQRRSK